MTELALETDEVLAGMAGKSVCIVGNAPEALDHQYGERIDAHDIVIRMNAGVPELAQNRLGIGERTTVLATARLETYDRALAAGCSPWETWWMKLTRLGRKQLRDMRHRTSALWAWPQHYEDAVAELCPHPTTGLRIAWLLAKVAEPSEVAATGFNFLGALGGGDPTSWWKDEKLQEWCPGSRSDMHDGARELQAFEALGYVLQDEQWWEAELSS